MSQFSAEFCRVNLSGKRVGSPRWKALEAGMPVGEIRTHSGVPVRRLRQVHYNSTQIRRCVASNTIV
jgi:hypothetical protein